jgi:hypothetical protein
VGRVGSEVRRCEVGRARHTASHTRHSSLRSRGFTVDTKERRTHDSSHDSRDACLSVQRLTTKGPAMWSRCAHWPHSIRWTSTYQPPQLSVKPPTRWSAFSVSFSDTPSWHSRTDRARTHHTDTHPNGGHVCEKHSSVRSLHNAACRTRRPLGNILLLGSRRLLAQSNTLLFHRLDNRRTLLRTSRRT